MDTDNEFGMYTTETEIPYVDNGIKIIIDCSWDEIPSHIEMFEDRVKYLYRLPDRLSFCLEEEQVEYLKKKINEIKSDNILDAAVKLNARSFRIMDWKTIMDVMIPEDYNYDGQKIFPGLVDELNKFITKKEVKSI